MSYWPKKDLPRIARRDATILRAVRDGLRVADAAARFGLHLGSVYKICKKQGAKFGPRGTTGTFARGPAWRKEIASAVRGGLSMHAAAAQARADATTAYGVLAGLPVTQNLTGQNLGGLTLTPGVYFFSSSAQPTGTLTLNGLGQADPLFVFQIGSTLTTASAASIVQINGGDACDVYFQVGSSATLGTGTSFIGTIIAHASDTLATGATVVGGVFALNGAVTLDSNTVTACAIPAPSSAIVGMLVLVGCGVRRSRRDVGCRNR